MCVCGIDLLLLPYTWLWASLGRWCSLQMMFPFAHHLSTPLITFSFKEPKGDETIKQNQTNRKQGHTPKKKRPVVNRPGAQ